VVEARQGVMPAMDLEFEDGHVPLHVDPMSSPPGSGRQPASEDVMTESELAEIEHAMGKDVDRADFTLVIDGVAAEVVMAGWRPACPDGGWC
jgi:hypothetical protein